MTDRSIREVSDLNKLAFDKQNGLLPVIAQDNMSGQVLMLAYANRVALEKTVLTGKLHLWSRSRDELWRKGDTSGNVLFLEALHTDCDGDTILARVSAKGPTCHTGERSCFGSETDLPFGTLARLDNTLARRSSAGSNRSYTVQLLNDSNLRLKKLGEETAELVAALATGHQERAVEEAADLVYHLLVALRADGSGLAALLNELGSRFKAKSRAESSSD